jgi:putative aldouronate transport system permease protein
MSKTASLQAPHSKKSLWKRMKENYMLYLFLLPALLYVAFFCYAPLYGIQIAFKNFSAYKGIWDSPWVGFQHFETFFSSYRFWLLLKNTLVISLYSLIAGFPAPIILALMINYIQNPHFKKWTQTLTYAPHFISTVVMVGMLNMFLSPSSGFVNTFLKTIGLDAVYFFGEAPLFKHVYVWSGVWQGAGWGAIIYIAALAGVSPELHEAAIIDGATKIKRVWYIDLPALLPTAIILLIMNAGSIMSVGFEKAFLMQTDLNLNASEIISTYVYKIGLQNAEYSYSTAIGLFNNVINLILLIAVNQMAKHFSETSLW